MGNMKTAQDDHLNWLGAGLLTAVGAHGLLCAAALPGLIALPHEGGVAVLTKAALVIWTFVGIPAAAYVGMKIAGIFNGRSYADARLGVFGTMLLPLAGQPGAVTAFALIPAGILALLLLRQADRPIADAAEEASPEISDESESAGSPTEEEEEELAEPIVR